MRFQVKNIECNPFRDMGHYPINKEKVAALRRSIQTTGFWDNIVARQVDDKAEIAYGHHRLEALREEFPPDHEVDLIIQDLDDEAMLRIMAWENMDGGGASTSTSTTRRLRKRYSSSRARYR